ncbi:MAG: diguanylate cyclase [Planctomycetota bacterium]
MSWEALGLILKIDIRRQSIIMMTLGFVSAAGTGVVIGDLVHAGYRALHPAAFLVAGANMALWLIIHHLRKHPPQTIIKGADPQVVRDLEGRMQSLQWQVELLTALREMGRVVSHSTNFQQMISEVFVIMDGLLNSESMTLFIPDDTKNLLPAARKVRQKILFGADIKEADLTNVNESAENLCTLRILEGDRLHLTTPLVADNEFIGVLSLELRLFGERDQRQRETERYESILLDMVKHVALVIKTDNLHMQGIVDALTGLYSKRHFIEESRTSIQTAQRSDIPLSLVMIDIDHFKKVNDTHGHLTGDLVLRGVSNIVREMLRQGDRAYRFGGEEIAVLLKGSGPKAAMQVAERIRRRVETEVMRTESGGPISVTLSLGVTAYHPGVKDETELVSEADKALYACKRSGRNQVRFYEPEGSPRGN